MNKFLFRWRERKREQAPIGRDTSRFFFPRDREKSRLSLLRRAREEEIFISRCLVNTMSGPLQIVGRSRPEVYKLYDDLARSRERERESLR